MEMGPKLRVLINRQEEPFQTCNPWVQDEWFIHFNTVALNLIVYHTIDLDKEIL